MQGKMIKNNTSKITVIFPGWAFDSRIFWTLPPDSCFIFIDTIKAIHSEDDFRKLLDQYKFEKFNLVGWSMGAYIAAEFARRYSERIEKLVLVSARESYEKNQLIAVKKLLNRNKVDYLRAFYKECFSGEAVELYSRFEKTLFKDYLELFSEEALNIGLDYLSSAGFNFIDPGKIKTFIVSGTRDKIAPCEEAFKISANIHSSKTIIMGNEGHMPFFGEKFWKMIT